jgi:hypothetical protein
VTFARGSSQILSDMCSLALHTSENETEPRKPGRSFVVVIDIEDGVGITLEVLSDAGEIAGLVGVSAPVTSECVFIQ